MTNWVDIALESTPDEWRARADAAGCHACGFRVGPSYISGQDHQIYPPVSLAEALRFLSRWSEVFRKAHILLAGGGCLWYSQRGFIEGTEDSKVASAGVTVRHAISLENTVELPPWTTAHAFTGNARELLKGEDAWLRFQRAAAEGLKIVAHDVKYDAALYCCVFNGLDRYNQQADLLAALFAKKGREPGAKRLIAVRERFEAAGFPMYDEGSQYIPENAFPSLAMLGGALYQLWVLAGSGPIAMSVAVDRKTDDVMILGVEPGDASPGDFLPDAVHAKLR